MPVLKMAYNIHGDRVPYNSKSASVRITAKGRTLHTENQGLPSIEYFYYGPRAISYLPEPLDKQIKSDISDLERSLQVGIMISLPFPEEGAKKYARSMEELYRNMPPATDGALLSTRMGW